MLKKLSLQAKLFVNFIGIAFFILLISASVNYYIGSKELEKSEGANISKSAAEIVDKIDRNLFERYGDVQAFQFNKVPSLKNLAYNTTFMNNMMQYYAPIYQLMIMTDRKGKVVAVNTVDLANKPVESGYILGKDFSQTTWFKTAVSGRIKPGQAFVEDPAFDEDVKKVYPASSGYAMNFTSPVYDKAGNILGVWTNRMDVTNINQIILDNLKVEKDKGLATATVHLMNKQNVILYDEKIENVNKDFLTVMTHGEKLLESQKDTFMMGEDKIYGVARSKGFSTYPSRNWPIVFSVDYKDAMHGLSTLKYANAGIFVAALLITVLLTLLATKSIVAPINGLVYVAEQVSKGDLAQKLPESFLKSDKRLSEAFSKMMDNLKSLVTQVQEAAGHVTRASGELSENAGQTTQATQQIASAIEDLTLANTDQLNNVNQAVTNVEKLTAQIQNIAEGAAEQASGLEKTSFTIEEMTGGIKNMSENAQDIAASAVQSAEAASQGSLAVEDTVKGMHRIKESVFETAAKIQDLGRQSQQIGEIVQVIDDIAEQTNLLALNAAIEAARAGEHGKGFAVVADEVRKLAERSSKATKEIADLINSIQDGTNNAVSAMAKGTKEVEEGALLADKAGASLKQILKNIEETQLKVQSITALAAAVADKSNQAVVVANDMGSITSKNIIGTEEMSLGSQEVNTNIISISDISQQNAALAEEVSASTQQMNASIEQIASSAQQLSEMARKLQDEVAKFKV